MTCEVIDTMTGRCLAAFMTITAHRQLARFDRTLRAVMWMDAFLSVAFVAVGLVGSPIVVALGLAHPIRLAVALVALVSAGLLAAFGAITAVAIMLRMREGEYFLPPQLRLPLPDGMRPTPWPGPDRVGRGVGGRCLAEGPPTTGAHRWPR